MNKSEWRRFSIYETILLIFSILNIVFACVNTKQLGFEIPEYLKGYIFCLSVGLYLGFMLCKNEYKRVINKIDPH